MYNPNQSNLVMNEDTGEITGIVTHWNPYGSDEAIVQYFDGSASSMLFKELAFPNGEDRARKFLNDKEAQSLG